MVAQGEAVARMTVEMWVDAETLQKAERAIDQFLAQAEDDDRLLGYQVRWELSDWAPAWHIPGPEDSAATVEP